VQEEKGIVKEDRRRRRGGERGERGGGGGEEERTPLTHVIQDGPTGRPAIQHIG